MDKDRIRRVQARGTNREGRHKVEGRSVTSSRRFNPVLWGMLAGIALGALFGGAWPQAARHVEFLGTLFIHALMAMVVPLILTSMVVGISNLGDVRHLGALGGRTLIFFLASTGMAVAIGMALVNGVQPGRGVASGESLPRARYRVEGPSVVLTQGEFSSTGYDGRFQVHLQDQDMTAMLDPSRPMTPRQVFVRAWRQKRWVTPWEAAALLGLSEAEVWERADRGELSLRQEEGRVLVQVTVGEDADGRLLTPAPEGTGLSLGLPVAARVAGKEKTITQVLTEVLVGLVPTNLVQAMVETQVLPLIVFSLVLGAVLTTLGETGRPVLSFFQGLNEAVMKMVHLLMYLAPVGIFGLLAARLGAAGGWEGFVPELARLARYAFTVIAGLALHGFGVLPLALAWLARRRPGPFLARMLPALTTAFSTASSSATLPLTMECAEKGNGISNRVASFVIPLGATINMNGTALYEAVAAIFIAQMHDIALGPVHMVIIFLTATLAAIGAAGIPEAGLVTMVIVLKAVNLPLSGVSLILVIDWFLDRCRTTINVWGDAVGAAVIQRWEEAESPEAAAVEGQ
ncbi:MAG TPA: dicarboxylate/amino acid:cation symporter [Candidatus Nitrosotenuis sp.]|jgi:solute carrier family 1 (high affinity glutamate transporter) protein 1|nr:dicarboxylate/amino acid:cation symporter [Candidatus Nitrosotenuis sp.]